MTVKELIEKLKEFPENLELWGIYDGYDTKYYPDETGVWDIVDGDKLILFRCN